MLTDDAERNAGAIGRLEHAPRGVEIRGHRLLHLNRPAHGRADLERLQAEVRKRADVHVVDVRPPAEIRVVVDERSAVLTRETPAGLGVDIRTGLHRISDVPVSAGMERGDCARADEADAQAHAPAASEPCARTWGFDAGHIARPDATQNVMGIVGKNSG